MDNFINLAKQGYAAYEHSQEDVSKTGGAHLNSPHHSEKTDGKIGPDIDADEAVKSASKHSEGAGDAGLFGLALSFIGDNKDKHAEPVDEEHAIKAHDKAYNKDNNEPLDATSLGSAAALQVLKKFTSGGGEKTSGSGNTQTKLIALAMSEAAKLFETKGVSSGTKQDAVNGAALTAAKLFVQSKFTGSGVTGGSSGSLSALAAQFLK